MRTEGNKTNEAAAPASPNASPGDRGVQHARRWLHPFEATLPPPRPCERDIRVWRLGIVRADDDLRDFIDRRFHWPMVLMALLVLPVLALEFLWLAKHPERQGGWIQHVLVASLIIIWLAFVIEFAVRIAVAECRLQYVRKHWLDIVVIVAPAFRAIHIFRLAKTMKLFTLRGVGFKMLRYVFAAILGMEIADRMAERFGLRQDGRKPVDRLTRDELRAEVRELRRRNDDWEAWYAAHLEFSAGGVAEDPADVRPRPASGPIPLPRADDGPRSAPETVRSEGRCDGRGDGATDLRAPVERRPDTLPASDRRRDHRGPASSGEREPAPPRPRDPGSRPAPTPNAAS